MKISIKSLEDFSRTISKGSVRCLVSGEKDQRCVFPAGNGSGLIRGRR